MSAPSPITSPHHPRRPPPAPSRKHPQYFCAAADYSDTVNSVCTFNGLGRAKCETAQFAGPCVMKVRLLALPVCSCSLHASPLPY
jgi:hypothetical protein